MPIQRYRSRIVWTARLRAASRTAGEAGPTAAPHEAPRPQNQRVMSPTRGRGVTFAYSSSIVKVGRQSAALLVPAPTAAARATAMPRRAAAQKRGDERGRDVPSAHMHSRQK